MASNSSVRSHLASIDSFLEPAAIAAIRARLPDLAGQIVEAIQREVPGYSRPLRGSFGQGIRTGVELALRRFTGDADERQSDTYRRLGYGELLAGRSLDALQSAYRVGARVAWREMSSVAAGCGASADAQRELAESVFAYIDELAGESIEGYAEAQLARAGDRERLRAALFALLMDAPPADPAAVASAAAEARWQVPETVACLLVERGAVARTVRHLSGDVLHGPARDFTCIVVPEPGRVEHEARAIAERLQIVAVLGPRVAVAQARMSLRWAELAGDIAEAGLLVAETRLAEIALRAAPEILEALSERALGPLAAETDRSRARLEATLLAWLRHQGSQKAIAAEMAVHPQTVRYRMRRLRDLFGATLADPDRRFELEIALRSRDRDGEGAGEISR